jgi:hypothetical protein
MTDGKVILNLFQDLHAHNFYKNAYLMAFDVIKNTDISDIDNDALSALSRNNEA